MILYCDGSCDEADVNKDEVRLNECPEIQNLSISTRDILKKIPVIPSRLKKKMSSMKVIMRFFSYSNGYIFRQMISI